MSSLDRKQAANTNSSQVASQAILVSRESIMRLAGLRNRFPWASKLHVIIADRATRQGKVQHSQRKLVIVDGHNIIIDKPITDIQYASVLSEARVVARKQHQLNADIAKLEGALESIDESIDAEVARPLLKLIEMKKRKWQLQNHRLIHVYLVSSHLDNVSSPHDGWIIPHGPNKPKPPKPRKTEPPSPHKPRKAKPHKSPKAKPSTHGNSVSSI